MSDRSPSPPGASTAEGAAPPVSSLERVKSAAEALGLPIEILTFERSTRTAAQAAEACGCDVAQIVKSMVFQDGDGALALVLVSGAHNADLPAIRQRHNLDLSRADAQRVREETGFAIGGVAPIGHITQAPVYMDETLLSHGTVWCAAGRPDSVFALSPERLRAATHARIIRVTA